MKKFITFFILGVCIINFFGCASFGRKFVREKKKEERPHPVVYFKDYTEDISYHDLYKKHFLYWKYWEMELIDALNEDNNKKLLLSVSQTIANLKSLESYLVPERQARVSLGRQELEKMVAEITDGFSTSLERLRLKQEVETHQRILEKELMYNKMKDFIKSNEAQTYGTQ